MKTCSTLFTVLTNTTYIAVYIHHFQEFKCTLHFPKHMNVSVTSCLVAKDSLLLAEWYQF